MRLDGLGLVGVLPLVTKDICIPVFPFNHNTRITGFHAVYFLLFDADSFENSVITCYNQVEKPCMLAAADRKEPSGGTSDLRFLPRYSETSRSETHWRREKSCANTMH